jgi:hypothetical protein
MAQNHESIAFVTHAEASEALQTLPARGEAAVVEYLKKNGTEPVKGRWLAPGRVRGKSTTTSTKTVNG